MSGDTLTVAARETIKAGSKSFALASILFGRREREAAWRLYSWCRYCDDVVDGQRLGHGMSVEAAGAPERLASLRRLTDTALETDQPVPPEFQALREVARAHAITALQATRCSTASPWTWRRRATARSTTRCSTPSTSPAWWGS